MSITKTYINGDITTLYNWLLANGTDFFTSVVNNETYISCYVGELEFLRMRTSLDSNAGIDVYTNSAQSITVKYRFQGYYRQIQWAYKTANGLVFSAEQGGTPFAFSIAITKDNNNNTTIVMVGETNADSAFIPTLTDSNTVYAISTESEVISTIILRPNTGKYATVFCPLIVSGVSMRYLPNVFYTPFAQYSLEGTFMVDGAAYLCNGLIAVRDV